MGFGLRTLRQMAPSALPPIGDLLSRGQKKGIRAADEQRSESAFGPDDNVKGEELKSQGITFFPLEGSKVEEIKKALKNEKGRKLIQ